MNRQDREKIASIRAKKAEVEQTKLATLLELEIDEVAKAEEDAIARIDKELERKVSSPKRKTAIEMLRQQADLAKYSVKIKTAQKIKRIKTRSGIAHDNSFNV
jgi:hypothetical protein